MTEDRLLDRLERLGPWVAVSKKFRRHEKPKDRSAISIPSLKRYQLRRCALGSRHFFIFFFFSIPQEKQRGISCVTEKLKFVDESEANMASHGRLSGLPLGILMSR